MDQKKIFGPRATGLLPILVVLIISAGVAHSDTKAFDRASEMLQAGKYLEAMKGFEVFVVQNPDHELVPAAKWAIAGIHFAAEKDYGKAALVYQNIILKHPNTQWDVYSRERLGMCYEERSDYAGAAQVYEAALEALKNPGLAGFAPAWQDVFKERVVACYRALGDLKKVIDVYQRSLQGNAAGNSAPSDAYWLADTYLRMADSAAAAERFTELVDHYPFSDLAWHVRQEYAQLISARMDYDWRPFDDLMAGVAESHRGRFEEAVNLFDGVIETTAGQGMSHAARFQKELNEFRRTADDTLLRERLQRDPGTYPYGFGGVPADYVYGVLDAVAEAKKSLARDSNDIAALSRLGFALQQIQAYYPAIDAYREALVLAPDSTDLYEMLGQCYLRLQAHDDAIAAFKTLTAMAPDDPNSFDHMAQAYAAKGDTARAIRFYEKALSVDPAYADPYYSLAEIYAGMGKNNKARVYLEKYIELAPDGIHLQEARAMLDTMSDK